MKKFLSLLLTAAVFLSAAACSNAENDTGKDAPANAEIRDAVGGAADDAAPGPAEGTAVAADKGEYDGDAKKYDGIMEMKPPEGEYAVGAAADGVGANGVSGDNGQEEYAYGVLTGGEWNDNGNWDFWTNLITGNPEWKGFVSHWRLNPSERIEVRVTSGGEPIRNAAVALIGGNGDAVSAAPIWRAVTDHNGTAYLFGTVNPQSQSRQTADYIEVSFGGKKELIEIGGEPDGIFDIELGDSVSPEKTLDLMLVCDTTGSMYDELEYLQKELENVINEVNRNHSDVPVRLSVNFYRDEGDDYVVAPYEFTDDIKAAVNVLKKQSAGGGGDYPEAVDAALLNAVNDHGWNEDSVKILLLVMDAPPHHNSETIANLEKVIGDAAAAGIRIIPVAASGADSETEFLLRCFSIMTGGTYTFLTDHSGIGESHLEPTIGEYDVEKLNEMLIRIIGEYLK
jgi:hypothetical protein